MDQKNIFRLKIGVYQAKIMQDYNKRPRSVRLTITTLRGTYKRRCPKVVAQKIVYVAGGKAQIRSLSRSRKHTRLGAQRLCKCGCDGQTSALDVCIYWKRSEQNE